MKKLMLTCAILCAISGIATAQDNAAPNMAQPAPGGAPPPPPQARPMRPGPNPAMMAEQRAKSMQNQLALTDDQYKKAYDAELEFCTVLVQARNRPAPGAPRANPAEMQQAIQKANVTKEAKYKEMLNADQWTKYQASNPKMPTPPPPPAATQPAAPAPASVPASK